MSKQKRLNKEPLLIKLTPQERYELWFNRNYQSGMENNPEIVPDYNSPYYRHVPEEIKLEDYEELYYLYHRIYHQAQISETKRAVVALATEEKKKLTKTEFFKILKNKLSN